MTDPKTPSADAPSSGPDPSAGSTAGEERASPTAAEPDVRKMEKRLVLLEAQLRSHAERLAEIDTDRRVRRQRALWLRLFLLVLALGAFFWLRSQGAV